MPRKTVLNYFLCLWVSMSLLSFLPARAWAEDMSDDDAVSEHADAVPATAKSKEVSIDKRNMTHEQLYGKDLKGVPFAMRYTFANDNDKSWNDASYEEREKFLTDWDHKEEKDKVAEEKRERSLQAQETIKANQDQAEQQKQALLKQTKDMQDMLDKQKEDRKAAEFQRQLDLQKQKLDTLRATQRTKSNVR